MHFNLGATLALIEIIGEGKGRRYIAWCHDATYIDPHYIGFGDRSRYPWNRLCRKVEGVCYVAITDSRRKALSSLLGIPVEEIRVVHDAIDLDAIFGLHPKTRRLIAKYDLYEKDLLLLFPTRILPRKNIHIAIRIIHSLNEMGVRTTLIITGPPDPHNPDVMDHFIDLKRMRSSLGLDEGVLFLYDEGNGKEWLVPDEVMPDFFKIADALLLTSRVEGFGIPIIEAGAYKLPVFANDIPQFREIGGEDTFYFNMEEEPRDIAKRIIQVYEGLRPSRMFKKVVRHFSWPMIFKNRIEPLLE
jgi:glycosyltransferase involved in cell wall biosynthesis